jgi:hypothetical protein
MVTCYKMDDLRTLCYVKHTKKLLYNLTYSKSCQIYRDRKDGGYQGLMHREWGIWLMGPEFWFCKMRKFRTCMVVTVAQKCE